MKYRCIGVLACAAIAVGLLLPDSDRAAVPSPPPVPPVQIGSIQIARPDEAPAPGRRIEASPNQQPHRAGSLDARVPALRFEPNAGQTADHVDAIVRGHGYTLALANGDVFLAMSAPGSSANRHERRALLVRLADANQHATVTYRDEQPGMTNYLIGDDPSRWRTGVRGYAKVRYEDVYPGIDLEFYGNPKELEHDFIVAPAADPSVIALAFEGVDGVRLDDSGDLVVTAGEAEVRQKRPIAYQQIGEERKRIVNAEYVLDGTTVRFAIGNYDRALPLVIDPVLLVFSTLLGGGGDEAGGAIAADAAGSAYVLGHTLSLSFPLVNPIQSTHAGGFVRAPNIGLPPGVPPPPWFADNWDVVVSKYTPDGSALMYSTYLGGAGNDAGHAIAVTSSGEAVVTGVGTAGFPSGPGSPLGGPFFVLKLNPTGTALTYIVWMWHIAAMALDTAGNAYLTGSVTQTNALPIVGGAQTQYGGGNSDAYLLQLNVTGTAVLYSTYLGGAGDDSAHQLTVAADANIAVVGTTTSTDFPLLPPGQLTSGTTGAFVTWFAPEGTMLRSNLLRGRFVLGSGTAAFGPDGSLYIAGHTDRDDFPTVNAIQSTRAGQHDMWIVKYSTSGEVVYSTYLGGQWPDLVVRIAADAQGRVYILGKTLVNWTSGVYPGSPCCGSYPDQPESNWDLTLVKLHASGALANAVQLGGSRNDRPANLALAELGQVYLTGITYGGFPLVRPLQEFLAPLPMECYVCGNPKRMDLFVTRMIMRMGPWPGTTPIAPGTAQRVTILGEEFFGDMRVLIGGQAATDVTVHDRTSMSVTVPALPAGLYDLTVIDSYGEAATEPNAIFYGQCSFEVIPPQTFLSGGGVRELRLTADVPQCGWLAQSSVDWVSFEPPNGVGSSLVRMTVKRNPSASARMTTVTIAGQQVVIRQATSLPFDFNSDGMVDLLWQHQTEGWLAAWTMDGVNQIRGISLSPPQVEDVNWKVVGTGDFDRDGQQDLVWQHVGDGRVAAWLMDGLTMREGKLLTPSHVDDLDWHIRAVGDLNGDGNPDLIWHHRVDGVVAVWFMEGLRAIAGELLTAPVVTDTNWQIVGAGDLTGPVLYSPPDGYLDLVWQHEISGAVAIWTMEGTTMKGGRDVLWVSFWKIRAVGDLTHDNALDFVVQRETTGEFRVIEYNPRVLSGASLPTTTEWYVDPNWRIVGPR